MFPFLDTLIRFVQPENHRMYEQQFTHHPLLVLDNFCLEQVPFKKKKISGEVKQILDSSHKMTLGAESLLGRSLEKR